jgi:hypothetical protein
LAPAPRPAARAQADPDRKGAPVQIQYLGFELKPRGRDYRYLVVDPKSENREITFTITNQSFLVCGIRYQDAAELCYQKLRSALVVETDAQTLPRRSTISDQELQQYREKNRPARRRF